MENTKSVIEVKKSAPYIFHEHLNSLNIGKANVGAPVIYRHVETGKEYLHLAGAISWPGKVNPGFILIMGVRVETDQIIYECLDEDQDNGIDNLLTKCITLRDRYGFRQTDRLFRIWYGDSLRFSSFLTQFNQKLRNSETAQEGIYLVSPFDFEKENHFELYLRQMQSSLTQDSQGRKVLYLGKCHSLRNAIQNLPADAATRFSEDDSPAIAAVGSLVHSLTACSPWTFSVHDPALIHNGIADYETYVLQESTLDQY